MDLEHKKDLAEIDYFFTHYVNLPANLQPIIHLLACARWPLMYSVHKKYGEAFMNLRILTGSY